MRVPGTDGCADKRFALLGHYSSEIRAGCANERPSGSVRGQPAMVVPTAISLTEFRSTTWPLRRRIGYGQGKVNQRAAAVIVLGESLGRSIWHSRNRREVLERRALKPTPLCRPDAERGTFIAGGTRNQCMWGSTERGRQEGGDPPQIDCSNYADNSERAGVPLSHDRRPVRCLAA